MYYSCNHFAVNWPGTAAIMGLLTDEPLKTGSCSVGSSAWFRSIRSPMPLPMAAAFLYTLLLNGWASVLRTNSSKLMTDGGEKMR